MYVRVLSLMAQKFTHPGPSLKSRALGSRTTGCRGGRERPKRAAWSIGPNLSPPSPGYGSGDDACRRGVAQGLVQSGMAAEDGVWALNVAAYANPR